MNRRGFLSTLATAAAGLSIDPERLLWVPGAKTIFLPSTQLVEAKTLEEAIEHGLVAVFADGQRMEIRLRGGRSRASLDARLEYERRSIVAMGGRIVENRQYTRHTV